MRKGLHKEAVGAYPAVMVHEYETITSCLTDRSVIAQIFRKIVDAAAGVTTGKDKAVLEGLYRGAAEVNSTVSVHAFKCTQPGFNSDAGPPLEKYSPIFPLPFPKTSEPDTSTPWLYITTQPQNHLRRFIFTIPGNAPNFSPAARNRETSLSATPAAGRVTTHFSKTITGGNA